MELTVLEQIEQLRLEMQKIASDKELADPRVVRVSQRLDTLLNKFYDCQRKKGQGVQRYYERRA